jgi:hypothetical protein
VALLAGGLVALPAPADPSQLQGGASSREALVESFLLGLRERDSALLDALCVTEDEYRELIIPGHVAKGRPPQVLSPEASEYFWETLHQKSLSHRDGLLARFGGRRLQTRETSFEKGIGEYAGHRVYKRLSVLVSDENGHVEEIRTGSIIERDGRFKFASFIRD